MNLVACKLSGEGTYTAPDSVPGDSLYNPVHSYDLTGPGYSATLPAWVVTDLPASRFFELFAAFLVPETYKWYLRHNLFPKSDYTFEDQLLATALVLVPAKV